MEINYYLDNQQIFFDQLLTGIREQHKIKKDEEKQIDERNETILENLWLKEIKCQIECFTVDRIFFLPCFAEEAKSNFVFKIL